MPNIPWFSDQFIGSKVSFKTSDSSSTWQLKQKISENADCEPDSIAREMETVSEARGVFICSRVDGLTQQEAVIKIRMQ